MAVKQNTKINGSTIAIIILSALVLITGGYIIYSKIIEDNNTIANNNSTDLNIGKTTDKTEATAPTDTYSTLFKKIVYRVDVETGTVSEL